MAYSDLRDFIDTLEKKKELKRVSVEVDPVLEITEFARLADDTSNDFSLPHSGSESSSSSCS